jgi:hypothetical protein
MIRVAVMVQVRETFIDSGSIMVLPDSQWEKFSSCEIFKTSVTIVCSRMGEEATSLFAGSLFLFAKVQWKGKTDSSFQTVFGSTG